MYDTPTTERGVISNDVKFTAKGVQVYYGDTHAIKSVDVDIADKTVTAFIGPSGCGKSTFLRCLNRMNDTIDVARVSGEITLDGEDIYDKRVDPVQLRAKVGMVFQKPNPFPKSIYDNVAYGPRIHGLARDKGTLDQIVQDSLERAALWEEVKDRLSQPGTGLSGGQQQRLCIARAVARSRNAIQNASSKETDVRWPRRVKERLTGRPLIRVYGHPSRATPCRPLLCLWPSVPLYDRTSQH